MFEQTRQLVCREMGSALPIGVPWRVYHRTLEAHLGVRNVIRATEIRLIHQAHSCWGLILSIALARNRLLLQEANQVEKEPRDRHELVDGGGQRRPSARGQK